jgi:hypothetical protein
VEHLTGYFTAPKGKPPTPSAHRLRLGLPGYLILFAPLAFAAQRQGLPREPLTPRVFLPISTDFTLTPGIPLSSSVLKPCSFEGSSLIESKDFTYNLLGRLPALYTQ